MKISKRTLDALKTPDRDTVHWDDELKGFGVRVRPGGSRTFIVQYRNAQGRERKVTIGQHGKLTADEARDEAKRLLAEVALKRDPVMTRQVERTAVTVKDLCTLYLAECESGQVLGRGGKPKKASTMITDRGRIERHIIPLMGGKLAKDIVPADVKAFMSAVAAGKTATPKGGVKTDKLRGKAIVTGGKGTARRTVGLMGGLFSFAVEHGHMPQNPVRGIKRGADGKREFRLDPEEYRALGRALSDAEGQGEHWQTIAITKLLALTGCRLSEIVKLAKSEVDLRTRCIRLSDNKIRGAVIPIGEAAVRILSDAMARGAADCPHVFPGVRKGSEAFGGFPSGWRRIIGDAYTPHGLRHAFGSTCDDLGMSELTIAALLGHSAAKKGSTTRGYIHKVDAVLLAAADKVAAHIETMMQGDADNVMLLADEEYATV